MNKKKKILIVEDNPANLKMLKLILENIDCEILEAVNGKEALNVAIEKVPDLILMDIQIPHIDGLEVTRRLRKMEDFAETPIVALTAFAMEKDEQAGLDAGCSEYMVKPFSTTKLLKIVNKYI
ncbi:MAG: response regulator [bacterium]|nr:response regulator [bacterium]